MTKSASLKAAGKDVINWHIGILIASHCWEASSEALRQGHVHYAPAAGLPALREALAQRAEEDAAQSLGVSSCDSRLYYGGGPGSVAPSILSVPGMEQRSFAVSTFSKTYASRSHRDRRAMDGWRLGWALCPDLSSASAVAKTRHREGDPWQFTQYAGVAALTASQDCVSEMLAEYDARRSILVEGAAGDAWPPLCNQKLLLLRSSHPLGAYYVFPDLSAFGGSDGSLVPSLRVGQCNANPGSFLGVFGEEGRGHARIAYSCSTEAP
eukprot:Skav204303  [mRNA]  locus=scaffold2227:165135:171651:- [translate_table: standard]